MIVSGMERQPHCSPRLIGGKARSSDAAYPSIALRNFRSFLKAIDAHRPMDIPGIADNDATHKRQEVKEGLASIGAFTSILGQPRHRG
jgi:hypothetical protein